MEGVVIHSNKLESMLQRYHIKHSAPIYTNNGVFCIVIGKLGKVEGVTTQPIFAPQHPTKENLEFLEKFQQESQKALERLIDMSRVYVNGNPEHEDALTRIQRTCALLIQFDAQYHELKEQMKKTKE